MKPYRIAVLLTLLLIVAAATLWERHLLSSWRIPVEVEIYPINGDGSTVSAAYLQALEVARFQEIAEFITSQSERYWVKLKPPVMFTLHAPVRGLPPLAPSAGANPLKIMLWSLKLRYWAYRHQAGWRPRFGIVRMFVLYHVAQEGQPLDHSIGLRKGGIGIVHAFARAEQDGQNNIVIAHELLHTLGATDKYDMANNLPIFPNGYGDRQQVPLYPQRNAEIMAGRLALADNRATMPTSLGRCVIGAKTAFEIGW